jgi:hypothetical protein
MGFARVLGGPIAWHKSLGFRTMSAVATPVKHGLPWLSLDAKLIEFARISDSPLRRNR